MGGHYLSNPGTPSTNVAVQVTNAENVTIQNGIIIGFAYGVYFNYTGGTTNNSGDVVQNLRLKNPVYGIVLAEATGAKVSNNQITNSNGTGIYGILCSSHPSGGSDVASGNIVSGFNGGILSGGNNYLFENILNNCATGLFMQASDKYRFNTTFNCTTPFNGGTAVTSENN
jgi:Periplasmic copper-binding protein (NosD)